MAQPFTLTVTYLDGEAQPIDGRAARLIAWIANRCTKINQAEAGALGFDYAGENIKPHLTEHYSNEANPRSAAASS